MSAAAVANMIAALTVAKEQRACVSDEGRRRGSYERAESEPQSTTRRRQWCLPLAGERGRVHACLLPRFGGEWCGRLAVGSPFGIERGSQRKHLRASAYAWAVSMSRSCNYTRAKRMDARRLTHQS